MIRQVRWVKENFRDEDYQVLKIFTSGGSFFDPRRGSPPPSGAQSRRRSAARP